MTHTTAFRVHPARRGTRGDAGASRASRNDRYHPNLPLHRRGRPHMTLPNGGLSKLEDRWLGGGFWRWLRPIWSRWIVVTYEGRWYPIADTKKASPPRLRDCRGNSDGIKSWEDSMSQISTAPLRNPAGELSNTMAGLVFDRLRTDILNGKLKPGDRLKFEHLSAAYNMGISPLREALFRLTTVGDRLWAAGLSGGAGFSRRPSRRDERSPAPRGHGAAYRHRTGRRQLGGQYRRRVPSPGPPRRAVSHGVRRL